jgi:hypothetical protein
MEEVCDLYPSVMILLNVLPAVGQLSTIDAAARLGIPGFYDTHT